MPATPTALVTGANRGIGLEHVRRFAERGWRVFACARDPAAAADLAAVARASEGRVTIHAYDAADEAAPVRLKGEMGDAPIDVLLNNAGVIGWGVDVSAGGASASQSFPGVAAENLIGTFRINAVAPFLLTRALVDNIAASERKIVAMQSSKMGSIADTSAGYYAYRASKTALNMIAKALAGDLKPLGVTVVTLHPGWVQTRMGGQAAPVTVEACVAGEQALFDRLTLADTGRFLQYDGVELPW